MAKDDDKKLGKYLLKSKLGQGGMGTVYLATDTRLKRDVAIKVLSPELSRDEAAVKRFLREARAAARLNHPNVVTVYDVDQQRGFCFLVMELVNGCSTADLLSRGPVPWGEATRLIAEACRGLVAAHEAGLIHRDIKPSNIMRTGEGAVKLADFGLVKTADDSRHTKNPLTKSGTILGTPHYMSPEQCEGGEVDVRSDVYSLGATYFALLTGRPPFDDAQPLQVMYAHCSKPVPDPRAFCPDLPEACAAVVMKSLAKKRIDRFGSANELLTALQAVLAQSPNVEPIAALVPATGGFAKVMVSKTLSNGAGRTGTPFDDAATALSGMEPPQGSTILLSRRDSRPWSRRAAIVGGAVILAGLSVWLWSKREPSSNDSTALNGGESHSGGPISSPQPLSLSRTETLEFVREWPDTNFVRCIAFDYDGKSLFTGTSNGRLLRWKFDRDSPTDQLLKCPSALNAVVANARWLFAGGDDMDLWQWDLTGAPSGKKVATLAHKILSLAISPDGSRLAVGTENSIELHELHDDEGPRHLRRVAEAHNDGPFPAYMVYGLRFSHDSRWLAATSWYKSVGIWDARTGDWKATRKDLDHQLMSVSFLPGDQRVVFGASEKEGLCTWDWSTPDSGVDRLQASFGRSHRSLVVSRHGIVVSNGEWDGTIDRYDLADGTRLPVIKRPTNLSSNALVASPDGRHVATGGGNAQDGRGFLHLWKVVSQE
jgi:serine/threonine protein kinase